MDLVSVRYLLYQSMAEKSKLGLLDFLLKKTLIWRKHCSIGRSCCNMTSKQSIDWVLESSRAWIFFPERSLNQPKATRVSVRSIDQSNRSISVHLLFLFCSRAFISRSFENRSIVALFFVYSEYLKWPSRFLTRSKILDVASFLHCLQITFSPKSPSLTLKRHMDHPSLI